MTTTTTRRTWTPVDELTLQLEFEEAHDRTPGHRWPYGWWDWQCARTIRDMRVVRATKEAAHGR